jgi:serine/threonine-protein kinase RsbT
MPDIATGRETRAAGSFYATGGNPLPAERAIMTVISAEGRHIKIDDEFGIESARRAARQAAEVVGVDAHRRVCLTAAVQELAQNMVRYAGGGGLDIGVIERHGQSGVRCVFTDRGPGVADPEQAMRAAADLGFGTGQGLAAARSLVDDFRIQSSRHSGTWIEIIMWSKGADRGRVTA